MTFLILKYGRKRLQQHDWRTRCNKSDNTKPPRNYTNNSAFFIKPHLTIQAPDTPETENVTISRLENPPQSNREIDPEVFKRKVWVLQIRSERKWFFKKSKTAYNCRIGLNIIQNNKPLFEELPLHWRTNGLPGKCNYTGPTGRHAIELPNNYVGRLLDDTKDTVKVFPVGTEYDALLLFTFEGCEYVYVITRRKEDSSVTNITRLDFNEDYQFYVRLYSDGFKELREKRFKCIVKSWDDITFRETK
jgi:hypothetical protein